MTQRFEFPPEPGRPLPRDRGGKEISGCAIAGLMDETGARFSGHDIIAMIANMRDRSNGLGGGFAAYGIYPQHSDRYALHILYDFPQARKTAEEIISRRCDIYVEEAIPTRPLECIRNRPLLHRYFVRVKSADLVRNYDLTEDDIIVSVVMRINAQLEGAFVFSSGRNMGAFKGVGYPEDIGRFFRLDEYEAYIWTAHGRFPTNTTGWWGGAHPFSLLDWSVVHNGEISSYGINRRYLANFGYHCALQTDTEVICYLFDLLVRKHGLSFEHACTALAPPFWAQVQRMGPEAREMIRALRIVYGGALLNGPFSVLVGHSRGMLAFNDRIKLRPMVAARKGDRFYVASEEAAIHEVCTPDSVRYARGGEPMMGELKCAEVQECKS